MSKDKANTPILHVNDAIFEIVPVKGNDAAHPVIESGKSYYIKNANNEYFTTTSALTAWSRPTFKAKGDVLNARKFQKWIFTIDETTGRWKIAFNNDKFIDEEGRINKNVYSAVWNSVILCEVCGKWAIQIVTPNATARTWGVTADNNINYADTELKDSYVFTIAEVEADDLATSVSSAVVNSTAKANGLYDLSGRKVKKAVKHGVYIKGGKKIIK